MNFKVLCRNNNSMCNKKEGREYLEKLRMNSLLLKHLVKAVPYCRRYIRSDNNSMCNDYITKKKDVNT